MSDGVVVVGAGQTGARVALELRRLGFSAPVTIIGDEPEPPYQRPPLSKAFLNGDVEPEGVYLYGRDVFEREGITLLTGKPVTRIDRSNKVVFRGDCDKVLYDKVVLATGVRNRPLNGFSYVDLGLHGIRTLADAVAFRGALASARRIVIVGGGFIGLEAASVAAARGLSVTVIEAGPRLMQRTASTLISDFFHRLHVNSGTTVRLNSVVERVEMMEDGTRLVTTKDGGRYPADAILVAVGTLANDELAKEAGIRTDGGIVIDSAFQTSAPDIYAIGDCAKFLSPFHPQMLRIESIQNSNDQATQLAHSIFAGIPADYCSVPWFWTEQSSVKLQIAGIVSDNAEHVVRGEVEGSKFSIYGFVNGDLRSVESVNAAADHVTAKRLIAKRINPAYDQVADPDFKLGSLL